MSFKASPSNLREWRDRGKRFLREDVWTLEPAALGALRGRLVYPIRMVLLVVEGTLRDHLLLRAAALTYKTIFSLVPLMAVMLAFFRALGGGSEAVAERIRQAALEKMVPGLGEVMVFLNNAISQVHAGAVGGIGVLVLIYTAISLLATVEQSFNHIWGVPKGRNLYWRCIIYWGVLTLGPVVAMASLTATSFVEGSRIVQSLQARIGFLNAFLLELMPFVFAWFGFAVVYYFMPNTRVQWRSAFAGGIVGGTLWELAKHGFIFYVSRVVTTFAIYGSLGAIPLFLLWIYLSWAVLLFGAEWAFAHQNVKTYRREIETGPASAATREELALQTLLLMTREFAAGSPPLTAHRIGEAFHVPVRLVNDILHQLGAAGFVREVAGGEGGFLPGRDPAGIPVKAVLDAVRRAGANLPVGRADQDGLVKGLLARADTAVERELGGMTLGEMVREKSPDRRSGSSIRQREVVQEAQPHAESGRHPEPHA
jgi:membrane protein